MIRRIVTSLQIFCLCAVLFAVSSTSAVAAPPGGNGIANLLISPELILQQSEKLGLTENQVEDIRAILKAAGPELQALQRKTGEARGRLAELLSGDEDDEEAVLKQLDQLLAAEKDQKRRQLGVMIRIRNRLTFEQRQTAAKLQPARGQSDEPLAPRNSKVSALAARSFEEVQSDVKSLRKQDVAWRKIAWKTCLLEGLKESREQKKPIMLWIFIDRPIDDERC
jgi:Spy/CpxP family protein refolding chaperone